MRIPTSSARRADQAPGGVDDHGALDHPGRGADTADPPALVDESRHRRPGRQGDAHLTGRRRELPGDQRRVEVAVLRREQDGPGPGRAEVRGPALGLIGRQELDLHPEGLRQRRVTAHARFPLRGQHDPHGPHAMKPDRSSRDALERGERLHGLVDELHHELGRGDLGREPRRPGRGLRAELVAVEQDDVTGTASGQMVGGAGAEPARPDDHDLGSLAHAPPLRSPRCRAPLSHCARTRRSRLNARDRRSWCQTIRPFAAKGSARPRHRHRAGGARASRLGAAVEPRAWTARGRTGHRVTGVVRGARARC